MIIYKIAANVYGDCEEVRVKKFELFKLDGIWQMWIIFMTSNKKYLQMYYLLGCFRRSFINSMSSLLDKASIQFRKKLTVTTSSVQYAQSN